MTTHILPPALLADLRPGRLRPAPADGQEAMMRIPTLISFAVLAAMATAAHGQAPVTTLTRNAPNAAAQTPQKSAELSGRNLLAAKIYTRRLAATSTGPASGASNDATVDRVPNARLRTMAEAEWRSLIQTYDHVGDISDVVVSDEGRIRQIVIGLNASLGLGDKPAMINWSDVNWIVGANGSLVGVIDRNKLQLEAGRPAQ